MARNALSLPTLRKLTNRPAYDPQRVRARKIEAKIIDKMPSRVWLSCTAVSRLIRSPDDRKSARGSIVWRATASSNASASRAATGCLSVPEAFMSNGAGRGLRLRTPVRQSRALSSKGIVLFSAGLPARLTNVLHKHRPALQAQTNVSLPGLGHRPTSARARS
jgi:hypothetical protein